jgi:DNA-directed RNA polymerase subunit RPC12/RpoP
MHEIQPVGSVRVLEPANAELAPVAHSGANPSPSSALRRGMPVNVVWTDGRSYPPVVSTWDARGVVVAFPNGQTNMVPLRAVRLRGPEFDVRSTVVVQSRVIERQTMVIRCKHCGEITALDGSRCRNCGSPSFK